MSDSIADATATATERHSASKRRAVAIAVLTTVVAFVFTFVAGIAFLIPLFLLAVDVQSTPAFLGLTVAGQLGFLGVAYLVARYRGMQIPVTVPSVRQVGIAVGGVVLALAGVTVLSVVLQVLGLVPGSAIEDVAIENPTLLLWLGGLSVVLIAPAEEFLFRGVVQGTLREAFGPVGAVAGASLLFGSLHLANYTGRIEAVVAGALVIVVAGAVLGALYELTDNLAVPVVTHGIYNLVLFTLAYATI